MCCFRMNTLVTCLLLVSSVWCYEAQTWHKGVEVELEQGRVAGQEKVGEGGRIHYEFLGIPFAQPPVGRLRFKAPVAAEGWEGVRDGSQHPSACPQIDLLAATQGREEVEGAEDCLYLNVFTPRQPSRVTSESLAVMVFIHGGSFILGSIQNYDPSPLLQSDVIIVTLQYRLGILGFVSTEDKILPGNLGLKDQTLALHWVKDNIHFFGGDPNRITLFGQSSGSASAHMQLLSPYANGLFQRVILQSGTALNPWAIVDNHRELAFKLGRNLNCSAEDSRQLLACLDRTSLHHLVFSVYLGGDYCVLLNIPRVCTPDKVWNYRLKTSVPRVDGDFLPDHPACLVKDGKYSHVDIMSGVTKHEGAALSLAVFLSEVIKNGTFRPTRSPVGALALLLDNEEQPEYLAARVALHYLPDLNMTLEDLDGITALFGDRIYKVGHEDTAELHAYFGGKVYQYQFDHRGQYSHTVFYNTSLGSHYTDHADDLLYLFRGLLTGVLTRPEDLYVRHIMTRLWTNFAITGNPTVNGTLGFRWTPLTPGGSNYLLISTRPEMKYLDAQNREFWQNLPTRINTVLYPDLFSEE